MHRSHTLGSRCPQRRACSGASLVVGKQPVQAAAAEMVSIPSEQPIGAISERLRNTRKSIKESGRDHGGVDVDPRQVDRDPACRSVEFGARRGQRFRPGSFVPAVANDDLRIRMMSGIGSDPLHGVVPAPRIVQTEARHSLARLDRVHMGIDEGGREQPTMKINFSVPGR
jgi:hypothetical protein